MNLLGMLEKLTLLWKRIKALFRYLICITLVPTSTANNIQAIQCPKAARKIEDSRLDKALVERTVYPPNRAQIPTSIPMKRPP